MYSHAIIYNVVSIGCCL